MKRSHRQAFTFVEMLAAMAFLGILMPVVISALMLSSRASVVAERTAIATQLAETRLVQLVVENTWSAESGSGDFGADWPGYRWELTRHDWEAGAMTELELRVSFSVQGREHDVRLTTLASDES